VRKDSKLVEVKDYDFVNRSSTNDDPTKRRVEIQVRWVLEDTRVFDVPADMSLDEVACNLEFDTADWDPEETQWGAMVIEDVDTEEEWVFD
jgi:hypothetical protein